ncbi:MAG: TOBE domain-containing protein, partial [bacterium]
PANTFVARFVGHPPMNLLDGLFENGHFAAGALRIPAPTGHPRGPGVLGIRPEDAHLAGQIPARVVITEPLGRETLVTLKVGENDFKVLADGSARPAPGAEVRLGYRQDRLHIFDQAGKRIGL